MNEKLKELVREAENYAAEQNDKFGVSYKQTYNEKFAQLIVEECATAIINDRRLNGVRSAANGCVRTLKEHFGVE